MKHLKAVNSKADRVDRATQADPVGTPELVDGDVDVRRRDQCVAEEPVGDADDGDLGRTLEASIWRQS